MKFVPILALSLLPLLSCSSTQATSPVLVKTNSGSKLSPSQKKKIGNKIWQNESGGSINGLTTWNTGEEFPSMGIGHFIWYPKGFNGRWTESFPDFVRYAQASGRKDIPAWVLQAKDCPWNSKAAFQADFNGAKLSGLRTFLANSVTLQTDFIIQKSQAALPKMLKAAPAANRQRTQTNYHLVATTTNGTYALIDYVNFKGEGINPRERYNNQGWGLLQVLSNMRPSKGGQDSARAFADSAKLTLNQRIKNSPAERGEKRWKAGWHNRCETYARAF
ncbi:hypothetical protein [Rubritalea profundi]|uniref:Uncharacterized protein n=1 Tax=Rubritalea profundi TaxID=1658618 RepID=A0A2S7U5C4_9BACT|nr:hypothetical protein [Rubritalea profundi]PQJ30216.1 hypothetical protein BSZ32_01620 [Rubritalea profundi]